MADKPLKFEAKVDAAELNKLLSDLQSGVEGAAKALNNALGGTVTKELQVIVKTDATGAKRLVAVEKERLSITDQIDNKLKQIQKTEAGSVTSLRQQVNQAKQVRDGIIKYVDGIGAIGGILRTVNPLWTAQNNTVAQLQRQLDAASASGFWSQIKTGFRLQGFISFLNGLTEITQGLQSASIVIGQITGAVNNLINTAADLQSFSLSFKAIGVSAGQAQGALEESSRIALGLGTNINTVQEGFRQLSPVVLNSGGSLGDVSAIVESLSSRFAAFGISGDKARRVTNGVIQAFAKGKLQAEELTQQISEADPAFKTDFANAVGVSVQELEKLVKTGRITSDVLVEALPKIGKSALLFGRLGDSAVSAADSLAEGNVTIDQVRNNLATLNTLSFRDLAIAFEPAINGFIKIQAIFTDFISRLSKFSALDAIGNILGNIAQSGGRLLTVFLSVAEAALRVLNVLAPLVDKLLEIPGVIELIGVAVLGKFLKPLQQASKAVAVFGKSAIEAVSGIEVPVSAAANASQGLGNAVLGSSKPFDGLSKNVAGAAKTLSEYESGTSKFIRSNQAAKIAVANTLREIQNVAGYPRIVSKEAIDSLRELGKRDPALAMRLLRSAIGETRKELSTLDKGGATANALRANIGELKNAMVDVVSATKNAGTGISDLQRRFRGLVQERNRLIKEQAGAGFGTAQRDIATASLGANAAEIRKVRSELDGVSNSASGAATRVGSFTDQIAVSSAASKGLAKNNSALAATKKGLSGVIAKATGALSAFGGAAVSGVKSIAAFGASALASLGPLGLALLAIGVAQGAYAKATEESRKITDEGAASVERYKKFIEELGSASVESPKLEGIALEWELFTVALAGVLDEAKGLLDAYLDYQREWRKDIADLFPPQFRGLLGGDTGQGENDESESDRKRRIVTEDRLARKVNSSAQSIGNQADTAKKAARAFSEYAKQSDGSAESQADLITKGAELRGMLDGTKSEYDKARAGLDAYIKSIGKDPTQQQVGKLGELQLKLDIAEAKYLSAKEAVAQFGQASGQTAELIEASVASLGSLNEKLKLINEERNTLSPFSDEFRRATVDAVALENRIKLLDETFKDPLELQILIPARIADKTAELNALLQRQNNLLIEPKVNAVELEELQTKIAEVTFDLDSLSLLQAKINVQIEVDRLEYEAELKSLQIAEQLIDVKARVGIDQPALRGAYQQINELTATLQELSSEQAIIRVKLQDTTLSASERLALTREEAVLAEKIRIAYKDSAVSLEDAFAKAKQDLADSINSLRNLKLNNLRFLPVDQQVAAIQELNREVQRIAEARGLNVRFTGSADEVLREKQAFVDFYNQLDKGENTVNDNADAVRALANAISSLTGEGGSEALEKLGDASYLLADAAVYLSDSAADVEKAFYNAAEAAGAIAEELRSLDGLTVRVNIIGTPGRWAGGPTQAGQLYRINELGQEGFLSASGRLQPIRKPKNALWRAPSSGTVIPAHIMNAIDIPASGVKVNSSPATGSLASANINKIAKAIQLGLSGAQKSEPSARDLAAVQAGQARQIGRLSHAITRLSEKDWNVKVKVNGSNNLDYMNTLNSRL